MANDYLVIIDMQNDFVDGSLGTPEACAIAPAVIEKARIFDGTVVFTLDTHGSNYASTQEGQHLPVTHCIKGTAGWHLIPELEEVRQARNARVFEKPTFGSTELAQWLVERNQEDPITSLEFIGVCTDICVVGNALMVKAFLPEVPVRVDASCCAGVTPQAHDAALATMSSCQVEIING